jgi:hypothetical protein
MMKIYCLYDPKKEDNRKWNQKLRITDGVFTLRLPTHNSLSGSPLTP